MVFNFPPSRIHSYISYSYQIQPRYHEVEKWYGYDQRLSIFRHHLFTTTSAIPIKFSTSVSWGWGLLWLWSIMTWLRSSTQTFISYTYQILNLGIVRLSIDMAMISGYQFSAITYSRLHQLYLSNSQPRYPEVENWYGYDQWLSIFRHHVFTTTSAIPIKFSTSVSWGWEVIWLWSVVINDPPSRIHDYISYTYQILNLSILRLRINMAMISGYQWSAITYSQLHQLYLSNSQPWCHEVENCFGYDQSLSCKNRHFCQELTTTSAITIKFSSLVLWGWELLWLWSIMFILKSSRVQWLHQLYLSNCDGYDQWLSCWSHHVLTTTSAIPIKFSTSVS